MARQAGHDPEPGACPPAWHRHGVPALLAVRIADASPRTSRSASTIPRTASASRERIIAISAELWPAARSPCHRARSLGRRAPAHRDRPLPPAEAEAPHHGRADVGADAAGGGKAVPHAAPARVRRVLHPLYQPQARGDSRALRQRDDHAARPRRRALPAEREDREGAGGTDDQRGACGAGVEPRRPAGFWRGAAAERRPVSARARRMSSAPTSRTIRLSAWQPGEILGIAGIAGNGQTELDGRAFGRSAGRQRRTDRSRRHRGRPASARASGGSSAAASCPKSATATARSPP